MRAVVCNALGDLSDLSVEDVPPPPLGDGGVRIAVRAAGLNFADTLIIAGKYQIKAAPPFTPGFEVAGTVLECAPGVEHCRPGDRVLAVIDWGGFAEQVVAPESRVFVLPEGAAEPEAAGLAVAYGTSHLGLTHRAGLKPDETLLIHGAAGGVGLTAVEIAKRIGANVIATAGGTDKLRVPAEYGADHLIDSRAEDIRERVLAITGGRGADVVYDPVGGPLFEASLRCTVQGGRILVVGFASGTVPQIPANILLVKNITVIGYNWGPYRDLDPQAMSASLTQLVAWLGEGSIRPRISETFPLEQAIDALKALQSRRTTGKVVLTVGD